MGADFHKSISDATISLSKIVVKYIDKSERCIDFLKHLNIGLWGENVSQKISDFNNNNNSSISHNVNPNNTSIWSRLKPISNVIMPIPDTIKTPDPNYNPRNILIASNLPLNVTNLELASLSNEIKGVFNHGE